MRNYGTTALTPNVNFELILRILSICTVSLIILIGIMMLTGTMIPEAVPGRFRVMMGSFMLLYGAYRVWVLWRRRPKSTIEDDNDVA